LPYIEMISATLRLAAVLATLVLLTSFSLFALDQAGGASQQAQAEVTSSGAQIVGPALHGAGAETGVRARIDDANRALVSPFQSFAPGSADSWASRSFELACGLLLYGLCLGVLARSTGLARRRRLGGAPRIEPHF
jgi:hypothetical protein